MRSWKVAGALVAATVVVGGAAVAGQPALKALVKIEAGEWQLRETGSAAVVRSLCLGDPAILLQPARGGAGCSRTVIADEASSATISYSCPGAGNGRTRLAVETPRVLHLQTQGVANGAPFDFDYEARRLGPCAEKPAR